MPISIRGARATDASECGRIMHAAFATVAAQYNFPPDFPSAEVASETAAILIGHPGFYGVVAEYDGRILGSNFLDERTDADIAACNELCRRVHGFPRSIELDDAIGQKSATVVEHLGRITGYATSIGFFSHAVGEANGDLKALIGAAPVFAGPGFLVPTRNYDVFCWCLDNGLRLVKQQTLMTIGLYNEPAGAYLPSVLY